MKNLRRIFSLLTLSVLLTALLHSCIEDGMSTSPSHQPTFSTDTVRMGTLFTLDASPTHRFIIYNRHDKGLNISEIGFKDNPDNIFRLNVDGVSGRQFSNMEIRANDSIFVFVEATLPENGRNIPVDILAHIDVRTNGVTASVPVKATGRDAVRLSGDTRFAGSSALSADKPYLVADSLVVEPGATLTIPAGTELFFHDDARIAVHGTLVVDGTAEAPVSMTGHRTGFVAADIPYEVMSGQWRGIEFAPTSSANVIRHATIRNSADGITIDHAVSKPGTPALTMVNTQVRNTKGYIINALHSDVDAYGCEFTDASAGLVRLAGGNHTFTHCTFANYYLFSAIGGPALQFVHTNADNLDDETYESVSLPFLTATICNSIIYGNGTELGPADLENTGIYIYNTLLRSAGSNDDHFIDCLWAENPLYLTSRNDYIFDYRLNSESPAAGAGNPDFLRPDTPADRYGTPRHTTGPTIGAYEIAE